MSAIPPFDRSGTDSSSGIHAIARAIRELTESTAGAATTGSFTGTLTGFAANPTGTVLYSIGADGFCTLYIIANINATSNANTLTMTGLPAAVVPTNQVLAPVFVGTDNGANVAMSALITAGASTVTFVMGAAFSATGFNAEAVIKGLIAGWQFRYPLT